MSLGSFFSRLFGRKPKAPPAGKRPAAAPPTAAPKAPPAGPRKPDPQPAPAKELSQDLLQGSAGAPGATMVFQTVPIATASLVVKSGGEEGSSHRLGEGRITVGLAPDSGVQIDHPSVGSPHVLIRAAQGRYTLYDMGNGGAHRSTAAP